MLTAGEGCCRRRTVCMHSAMLNSTFASCARRRVALRAHGAWAAWAARALGGQLGEAVRSDAALTSPHPLRGWEETVVLQARLFQDVNAGHCSACEPPSLPQGYVAWGI